MKRKLRNIPKKSIALDQLVRKVGKRIVVVGTSGSGKTTLAKYISKALLIPHVELDAFHFGPNWTEIPKEIFYQKVDEVTQTAQWVMDGNYSQVREMIWKRADTLIWLDYSFWVILKRVLMRTIRRCLSQERLWSGNQESFRRLFSKDSIVLWALSTYHRRRKDYTALIAKPEFSQLKIFRLQKPF